jgi:hypothetical protein
MIGHVAKVSTHIVVNDTGKNGVWPSEFEGHKTYFRLLVEESWVASPELNALHLLLRGRDDIIYSEVMI